MTLEQLLEKGWIRDWSLDRMVREASLSGWKITRDEVREQWTQIDKRMISLSAPTARGLTD